MNGFAKDSMLRFGDDLTEEILQYLTFEDKIAIECVSKQLQRCIYQRQFVCDISDELKACKDSLKKLIIRKQYSEPSLNRQALESVLKNCQNITTFSCHLTLDGEVLSLIGQYCQHIRSLTYSPGIGSDEKALDFFVQNGHKLEELRIFGQNRDIELYLAFCPNLKNIFVWDFSVICSEGGEFLPNLERIESFISIMNVFYSINRVFSDYVNKMTILSNKYSKTMKSLRIEFCRISEEGLKTCIECMSRFENLTELTLSIKEIKTREPIDDCLSLIGQKCNKLLKLDLDVKAWIPSYDRFFHSLSEYKAIKKLRIKLPDYIDLKGSIRCFKHCKQLIDLDITCPELTEDFFINIESFLPKLQFLRIVTQKRFSDSFIDSFHSMKDIQKVSFSAKVYDYEDFSPVIYINKCWYFGQCLSQLMLTPNGLNVIRVNDNCGFINHD